MPPDESAVQSPVAGLFGFTRAGLFLMMREVTRTIGSLVGAVFNASSSWNWASLGKGRRALFLFENGLLVMETNLRGSPLGGEEWSRRFGDMDLTEAADHVDDLAALDPRNLLIPVEKVESARLTSRHTVLSLTRLVCLDLRFDGGREAAFFLAPRYRYHRLRPDGSLARPRGAYEALVADMERVLGSRLWTSSR